MQDNNQNQGKINRTKWNSFHSPVDLNKNQFLPLSRSKEMHKIQFNKTNFKIGLHQNTAVKIKAEGHKKEPKLKAQEFKNNQLKKDQLIQMKDQLMDMKDQLTMKDQFMDMKDQLTMKDHLMLMKDQLMLMKVNFESRQRMEMRFHIK